MVASNRPAPGNNTAKSDMWSIWLLKLLKSDKFMIMSVFITQQGDTRTFLTTNQDNQYIDSNRRKTVRLPPKLFSADISLC